MKGSDMQLISTTDELAAACKKLQQHPFITVDTEFLRETTYYPRLCLIQMASVEDVALVDPLAQNLSLDPFLELMADKRSVKVFHAARQDVEIIWNKGGFVPAPLFDTQIAAMVCGFGEQVSYESLASALANARIDKSSRFTDWSRRPLSDAQLVYAAADVTHLRTIYTALSAKIEKSGRSDWVMDEMRQLVDPETYEMNPDRAWERLKTRVRKPRELAALIEVAAWREREAQSRDVPRGRILKDDAIGEIATAMPASVEELGRLRTIPKGFERSRTGTEILAAVERAKARPLDDLPPLERQRGGSANGALTQLLKVLLQAIAEKHRVAARLIATSEDIEKIALDDEADTPALKGWRRELFGEQALQLKRGEITIGIERGRIMAVPRA
jgi:ribonuclease D